jgi:hypothetical protein
LVSAAVKFNPNVYKYGILEKPESKQYSTLLQISNIILVTNRADPRQACTPRRIIIFCSLKPIFFKLFWHSTGLANFLRLHSKLQIIL